MTEENASTPFREEDLEARVRALRAERDTLRGSLAVLVRSRPRGPWSGGRFLLGLALLPAGLALLWWLAASSHG